MSAGEKARALSGRADNIGRSGGQHSPPQRTVPPLTVRQSGLIVTKVPLLQSGRADTSNIPVGGAACRYTQADPPPSPHDRRAPPAHARLCAVVPSPATPASAPQARALARDPVEPSP